MTLIHKSRKNSGFWLILCDPDKWVVGQTTKHNGKVTCPNCLKLLRDKVSRLKKELS